ncbi:SDR family oxidoreductase [Bosea sp. CS1GBMeth4]|uniref:SDR family NAD(P)-dependent oxidoreductase n=1 Tax=Bosea sp. CS1GBMeth4 TaxID=1892849 RepID=UPI001645670D|nr:SDR family oxidoreductase [Bosea sp. CS1GBMeth4]
MTRLAGKTALVTGGSRGIGAATTLRLAQDGADVALTYERARDRAEAVAAQVGALGRRAVVLQADSADPAALTAAVDKAAAELGGLDILVNNAGIWHYGEVGSWGLDEIDKVIAVNVRAVIVASQAAARHLRDGGRIITTGSCLAERVTEPGIALYAMSKAALIGFTKGLARDLGPRGITVNIVHPGSTDTDMNPADGDHAEAQRRRMAIPRFGEARDIAGLVAYLASEEGRFITGAGIAIDGGVNT